MMLRLIAVFALILTGAGISGSKSYGERLSEALSEDVEPCGSLSEDFLPWCMAVRSCSASHGKDEDSICDTLLLRTKNESSSEGSKRAMKKPSTPAVWGYGILCVTIISLTSVLGVGVLPLMSKSFYEKLLSSLIGLAVGSLSASALFHLIPSAFLLSDFYDHHAYLDIALVVWGGVYLFFLIERAMKLIMEYRNLRKGTSKYEKTKPKDSNGNDKNKETDDPESSIDESIDGCVAGYMQNVADKVQTYEQSNSAVKASFGLIDKPESNVRPTVEKVRSLENPESKSTIATVAWMIIFGDGVHNFIDGLSIGAAFTESILTGISVSIAVFCEEFPHELGDFAVLLSAGMSVKQAMIYNFLSACTCYLGLFIGILLGELDFGNHYIFAIAGGMFLYISLVDMIPELNETVDKNAKTDIKEALVIFLLQNIGMIVGIAFLFVLAKYQDSIQIGS